MSEIKNDTEEVVEQEEIVEEKNEQECANYNQKSKMKILKKVLKQSIAFIVGAVLGMIVIAFGSILTEEEMQTKIDNQFSMLEEKDSQIAELKTKVDSAEPWFGMKEEEQKKIEEQNAKIEAERLAAEQNKAEEERLAAEKLEAEEIAAAEAKEKQGYDTGITYSDLARNPKDHIGEKVKFKGKVIQVLEGDSEVQIRLAVNGNYDNIIYCVYDSSLVDSRVLEDDYITVMGLSSDVITYDSTIGGSITIPSMLVQKIDM